MSDERKIYGLSVKVPVSHLRYPELVEHARERMRHQLRAGPARDGYEPIGEIVELPGIPFRFVKEHHHEHGWQWVEQECPLDEAEYLRIMMEVTCAPR